MALVELATTLILTTTPTQVAEFDKDALRLEIEKNLIISLDNRETASLSNSAHKVAASQAMSRKESRQAD